MAGIQLVRFYELCTGLQDQKKYNKKNLTKSIII